MTKFRKKSITVNKGFGRLKVGANETGFIRPAYPKNTVGGVLPLTVNNLSRINSITVYGAEGGVGDAYDDKYNIPLKFTGDDSSIYNLFTTGSSTDDISGGLFMVKTLNLYTVSDRTYILEQTMPPTNKKKYNNSIIIGCASNGYTNSSAITEYDVIERSLSFTTTTSHGIGFDFKVSPGETYTISGTGLSGHCYVTYFKNGLYASNSGMIGYTSSKFTAEITVPEDIDMMVVMFRPPGSSGGKVKCRDLMVLNGTYTSDTVPDYEPYGTFADVMTINPAKRSAIVRRSCYIKDGEIRYKEKTTEDVSNIQDWTQELPQPGTYTVTAETSVQPSRVEIKY